MICLLLFWLSWSETHLYKQSMAAYIITCITLSKLFTEINYKLVYHVSTTTFSRILYLICMNIFNWFFWRFAFMFLAIQYSRSRWRPQWRSRSCCLLWLCLTIPWHSVKGRKLINYIIKYVYVFINATNKIH